MSKWSSRKFWSAMFWQAVLVWMRVDGYLPVEAFVSLTTILLGGYFVANVANNYVGKKAAAATAAPTPAPAPVVAVAPAADVTVYAN